MSTWRVATKAKYIGEQERFTWAEFPGFVYERISPKYGHRFGFTASVWELDNGVLVLRGTARIPGNATVILE